MFNPVSHRQGGVEASMIIHHAFQRISQSRVIARGTPKIATTTIVTNGETTPTAKTATIGNHAVRYERPREYGDFQRHNRGVLICFKEITVKTFFSVCNPATCSAKPTYAHQ
nr:hypothetical protein CFP56_05516 [Quercus suber]